MKLTKKLEAEILKAYHTYWDAYLKGDIKAFASFLDDDISIFGTAISEVFNTKKEAVRFYKATADQLTGKAQFRNRQINVQPVDDTVFVNDQNDFYVLIDKKWTFYGHARITAIFKVTKGGWKLVHQHASFPDTRAEEGEQVAAEKIKKENLELRDAVKRRTIELEEKNRELEIETALEKVRAVAMGMKKADDMLSICKTISKQLAKLGVKEIRNVQTAIFYETKGTYINYEYYAKHDKLLTTDVNYTLNKEHKAFAKKMLKGAGELYTHSFKGKKLKDWYKYQQSTNQFADSYLKEASSLNYYMFSLGTVMLGISTYSPLSDQETDLFKRFLKVFELAYRRYLDIEKAEAQAREAQIEASLEKVRAQALGMHKPTDLLNICQSLFKELVTLGFDEIRNALIHTFNDEQKYFMDHDYSDFSGGAIVKIPYGEHPVSDNFLSQIKRSENAFFEIVMKGKELTQLKKFRKSSGQQDDPRLNKISAVCYYVYSIGQASIGISTFGEITEEKKQLLKRFRNVFDFAYRRYIDVATAEAQAREAQIEAALEKVRAVANAMHKSNELLKVISILSEQFQHLGFKIDSANFNTSYRQKDWNLWLYTPGSAQYPDQIHIPYFDHPYFNRTLNALAKGSDFSAFVFTKKEKDGFLDHIYKNTLAKHAPDERKKFTYDKPGFAWSVVYLKNTAVTIANYDAEPYTEEQNAILRRFGNVFEQSYTRFLDLQKAEAQAKEAQIETALEKVRSTSLAMHHSDELEKVVVALFDKLLELGISFDGALIYLFEKKKRNIQLWVASRVGPPVKVSLPHNENMVGNAIIRDMWTVIEKGEDIINRSYSGKAKNDYYRYVGKNNESKIPESIIKMMLQAKNWTVSYAAEKNSFIGIDSWAGRITNDEDFQIVKRFARVFEQAYTRFLDLQKAEAQARESQIQLAMERVRARTMAMQKSEELAEISSELFKQVQSLGIATWHCAFNIYDEGQNSSTEWGTNAGGTYPTYKTPREGVFLRYYEVGQTGETLYLEVIGEDRCADHYAWLCTLPGVGEQLVKLRDSGVAFPTSQIDHVAYFKYGYLLFITYEPVPEAHEIFKRFANVFEQTYTRFLDLQKAEAQAKESQIQLALERVRARTMAMQRSDELMETAAVLFNQLNQLGENIERTIIGVMNEEERVIDVWATRPDGSQMEKMQKFSIDEPIVMQKIYVAWQEQKKSIVIDLRGKELESYFQFLKARSSRLKRESFGERRVENFAFFSKGFLGVINANPKTQANVELYERFAAVFEQTYTRFLDLQKAETQAKESQIQLALERVRARTMAMHKSDELAEVVSLLYKQFEELDFDLYQILISIINQKENVIEWWSRGFVDVQLPQRYIIPIIDHPFANNQQAKWKSGIEYNEHILEGENKNSWEEYLFTQTDLKHFPQPVKDQMRSLERVYLSDAFMKYGVLQAAGPVPLTSDKADILVRFAKVLDLAYTRMTDLQNAEAQTREAQIELGLERVRAKAMAMQRSDELKELIGTVFTELTKLDIVLTRCLIMIYDLKTKDSTWWMANSEAPSDPIGLIVQYHELPAYLAYVKAWEEKQLKWQYILEGATKKEWDDFLFVETELSHLPDFVIAGMKAPDRVYLNASFNSFGNLTLATLETLSEEHFDIMLRFAKVFDLTYTRFNDLQKAEAQTREAKIEAALERVRSKTMAMHKSDELLDIIIVVSEQLQQLNIKFGNVSFGVNNQNYDLQLWMAVKGYPQAYHIHWTFLDNPGVTRLKQAQQQPEKVYADVLTQAENNEWLQHIFNCNPALDIFSDEARNKLLNSRGYARSIAVMKDIFLVIGNYAVIPYTDDENTIFRRFANVFEQAYKRFLDLQKAEAQAREAQIETGLERVRSRTMAMFKSDELAETAVVLFKQMINLGIEPNRLYIAIINDDSGDLEFWITDENGEKVSSRYVVNIHKNISIKKMYEGWVAKKKTITIDMQGKELEDWLTYWQEEFHVPFKPGAALKRRVQNIAYFSKGFVAIASPDDQPATTINLLERFAAVFNLTYTRFSDLQQAEAQAREAQIEAGLERVRYSAMAMQSSEDVGSATAVVFNEISLLGVEAMRCGITVIHPDKTADVWAATTTTEGKEMKGMGSINFNEHPLWVALFEAWKNKEETFTYALTGDDLKSYYKALANSPNYNSSYIQNQEFPDHFFYACFFEQGAVFTFSLQPHNDEKRKVLKRFTAVFSLTFRRYLDLQQAEAQAREAKIEASLERVRSKAMAMHSSQDLADTIGVFYNELHSYSITPRRCGVGLLDKEDRIGELFTWNTTEDGHSLELVGKLKMEGHPVLNGVYEHWLTQTEYHPVIRGNEIKEYYQVIRPQMNFPDYTHDDVQYGYFFFFREGGVYAWTQQEMKDDELQIYRRFTSVLSLTYKRYKDLQQAESNAREAQIEAALEKVRSRTLAMQKSDELAETASEVFRQLIGLGIEPNRLYIGIVNADTQDMEMWATDEDGSGVGKKFSFNAADNDSVGKLYDGWAAKKKSVTVDMQGTELQNYINYLQQLQIPMSHALTQKRRVQSVAYFDKGFIGMASPDEQSGKSIQLLERFAAVFNLTFTRFNDLKIAEAHALQAEEDLVKLHEEKRKTEEALAELQSTQRQLIQSEKMASLGELTAGIAHEIQNPLNFVNNFSDVSNELIDEMMEEVAKGNIDDAKAIADDIKQNLEKINHHGKRADGIVKGMLQHSRSGSGQKELTDINTLADEYLRLSYHGLRAKDKSFNAKFETDFDSSIEKINVMPQDIGRVILNLINNAFYAVSEKRKQDLAGYEPTVMVSTKKTGDKVLISVKDNGIGISQKVLDKVFQPFFTTKPTGQGTGLGLSLAYDIITKGHSGELKVETQDGEGSVFIIHLPIN